MMPLTMAKAGDTVTIQKITGKDEVRLHLAELGFVVDSQVLSSMRSQATSSFRSRRAVWPSTRRWQTALWLAEQRQNAVWETLRNWKVSG